MIKFSDFIKNIKPEKKKESILSWDGSFAAIRNKESILSWPSSHAEIRDKKDINESILPVPTDDTLEQIHPGYYNPNGKIYDDIHEHSDITPQKLTPEHIQAIDDYTHTPSAHVNGDGSSQNINGYLRNRLDDNPETPYDVMDHEPEDVEKRVKQLSSAFTPDNTNRKPIKTYSGIPPSIGVQLQETAIGDKHIIAGFTSTSTNQGTAKSFAERHARYESKSAYHPHILVCHVESGAGLSIAPLSKFNENEILIPHGAHVTYRGTEHLANGTEPVSAEEAEKRYKVVHLHHVTIHATRKPLEEYPEYKW